MSYSSCLDLSNHLSPLVCCYLAAEVWRSWHPCRRPLSVSSLAPWSVSPQRSPRPPYWLLIREKKSFWMTTCLPRGLQVLTAHTSTGSWWPDELFGVLEGFWRCLWPPGLVGPMKNKDRRHWSVERSSNLRLEEKVLCSAKGDNLTSVFTSTFEGPWRLCVIMWLCKCYNCLPSIDEHVMIFKKKLNLYPIIYGSHKWLDMLTLNLISFPISIFCWKCAFISKMAYIFGFFN